MDGLESESLPCDDDQRSNARQSSSIMSTLTFTSVANLTRRRRGCRRRRVVVVFIGSAAVVIVADVGSTEALLISVPS